MTSRVVVVILGVALFATPAARAQLVIDDVSPSQGTLGTAIEVTATGDLGKGKPKLFLLPVEAGKKKKGKAKPVKLKLEQVDDLGGGASLLHALLKKGKLQPGLYDLMIKPKGKGTTPATLAEAFTVNGPMIASVNPGVGAPKSLVTITGTDFGQPKKPKVKLGKKKAKVVTAMGGDTLLVKLPKLKPGTYDLLVQNKVGADILPGSVTLTGKGGGGPTGGGKVTVLHDFDGSDGSFAVSRLLGVGGDFYGTTWQSGANGCGTVFRVTPAGSLTTLHHLDSTPDGCRPKDGLTLGPDGALYGAAQLGGAFGLGTVFRVTTDGDFTTLTSFGGTDSPGGPSGRLALGADDAFYGTSVAGGADVVGGTVYRVTTGGDVTVLHSFTSGGGQGSQPLFGLVLADDGNFYGSTDLDGNCPTCGTLFRITPAGAFTLMHAFSGANGDGSPGPLTIGPGGDLYGATELGGASGFGAVYKLTLAGQFSVVHSFDGSDNASVPEGGLVLADDGNLYGTANVVYRISPQGNFKALYDLLDLALQFGANGPLLPQGGVTQGPDGALYGTSAGGGAKLAGTLFKVKID